jgi:hypothetical protein
VRAWDELVADAVLGTVRRPPTQPEPAGPVDAALAQIDWTDPEGALLTAAATVTLYREAGRRAERDTEPLPTPAAPDPRPRCSDAAATRLGDLLAGVHRALLPDWLAAADSRGLRVPEEHLPALLDLARWQRDLRDAVLPVIGERGRWLAAVNPDWSYAAGRTERPQRDWLTAPRDARPLLLARLRRSDAAAARGLLEQSWATEAPADRARLLEALADGLSIEDEPFVEAALADRRKEVRRAAADLLARLPQSRLGARMADRLTPLIGVQQTDRGRFLVALPTAVDDEMARDGVVAKPPTGIGERTWWLHQVVAATPLEWWAQFGAPPRVVELAICGEQADAMLKALTAAAISQRAAAWADALLPFTGEDALIELLPKPRREQLMIELLDSVDRVDFPTTVSALLATPAPWGSALSRSVVAFVGRLLADPLNPPSGYLLRDTAPAIASAIDPAVVDEATELIPPPGANAASARLGGSLVEMMRYRRDLLEELQ